VQIFQDSKEGDDLEKNLQAAVKASYCHLARRRTLLSLLPSRCSQAPTTAGSRECRVRLFTIWRDTVRGPVCWRQDGSRWQRGLREGEQAAGVYGELHLIVFAGFVCNTPLYLLLVELHLIVFAGFVCDTPLYLLLVRGVFSKL